MNKLKAKNFDVLFVTGGMGVNKGLTDFAEKLEDMKVDDDIEIIILDFFSQKKYLAFCSNAPILLAKVLGKDKTNQSGALLTFGGSDSDEMKKVAEKLGNKVMETQFTTHVTFDQINKIVTVPGNSSGRRCPADVFMSITAMVQQVNNNIKGTKEPTSNISVITRYELNKGKKDEFEDAIFDYSYLTR